MRFLVSMTVANCKIAKRNGRKCANLNTAGATGCEARSNNYNETVCVWCCKWIVDVSGVKEKTRVYFDLDVNGSAVATVKVSAWIDVRKDGADRLLNRLIFII